MATAKQQSNKSNKDDGGGCGDSFLAAFDIQPGDAVSLVGAGGKTSLMFRLAMEARALGQRVLVTTSTKIYLPEPDQYDVIDLSGQVFKGVLEKKSPPRPAIYVAGMPSTEQGKMAGPEMALVEKCRGHFDLILIEADGAAGKSLKGWNSFEPVVPGFTSKTIGLLDIQTVDRLVSGDFIHRLDIFRELTGTMEGQLLTTNHLCQLVGHKKGLFSKAIGEKILYINKVESAADRSNVEALQESLGDVKIIAGSLRDEKLFLSA